MPRRTRRKTSLIPTLLLWVIAAGLIGWGVWQAAALRRTLLAEWAGPRDLAQPEIAVGSATVIAQGAQGGEPWSPSPVSGMAPPALVDASDSASTTPSSGVAPETDAALLEKPPAVDASLSADELAARGRRLLDAGNAVAGRSALNAALARAQDPAAAAALRSILAGLNEPVFLGTAILPDDPSARFVDIEQGDSFLKLGREYGVPGAFLQSINPALSPQMLKPLTGVKIVQGPFHMRISRNDRRLDLFARDVYVRSFGVDFPEGNDLPRGEYQVAPGTKLQLGGHTWIGFEGFETATQDITAGWIFGDAGPRGSSPRDRQSGIHLADSDLAVLYNVLSEGRSRMRVDP